MSDDEDEKPTKVVKVMSEIPQKRVQKKVKIPRRAPSVIIPEPRPMIMTAGIKSKPIKLRQCQVNPLTLYELSAAVLDQIEFPQLFDWSEEQVADWMEQVVGLPQYRESILDNHINGRRLLLLEDPSGLPEINIHDLKHMEMITAAIRKEFGTDYQLFTRSVGLPIRKPLTHCTLFKSRTGPPWGIRQNWTRSDILRWMKIIMPKPVHLDHWDRVWYMKPDFPKVLIARLPGPKPIHATKIPQYIPTEDYCNEYTVPRHFRLQTNIPDEAQFIWMEHRPGSPSRKEPSQKDEGKKKKRKKESRLMPKKLNLTGLAGKDLILARRKTPKPKFLPS